MKKTFSENTIKKPPQKVTRLEQAKRLRQEAEAILIDLAAEYGHSNESCDCPCGHEQTCERCGFYGRESTDFDFETMDKIKTKDQDEMRRTKDALTTLLTDENVVEEVTTYPMGKNLDTIKSVDFAWRYRDTDGRVRGAMILLNADGSWELR